jgi:hypothetical protein
MKDKWKDVRFYKVKNPTNEFICALCTAPRQTFYHKNLTRTHYIQIALISLITSWLLFDVMKEKVVFLTFIIWTLFEVVNKLLYRKEIPCPYCGFDATWYKRDVKVARRKVEDYWKKYQTVSTQNSPQKSKAA